MGLFQRKSEDWELRLAILRLFELQENRITDLEEALKDAGIAIPFGRGEHEREERIARGKKMMGLE